MPVALDAAVEMFVQFAFGGVVQITAYGQRNLGLGPFAVHGSESCSSIS
jgi:hypothetical protein